MIDYLIFLVGFSVVVGGVVAGLIVGIVRHDLKKGLEGVTLGIVERVFFTLAATATPLQVILPTMVAWVAARMASQWNIEPRETEQSVRMAALAGGLTSMLFAFLGSLLINDEIWFFLPY